MTDSTKGSRQRLFGPAAIGGLGLTFVAAFVALAYVPRHSLGITSTADAHGTSAPDNVQVAYLRAAAASESADMDVLFKSVLSLARDGRMEDAKSLMGTIPPASISNEQRAQLQLELRFGAWRTAAPETAREKRGQLYTALKTLRTTPAQHSTQALQTAVDASGMLQDAELIAEFHQLLARTDPSQGVHWLRSCGDALVAAGAQAEALSCYQDATALSTSPDERFKLQLLQLAIIDDERASRQLASNMITATGATPEDRELLAALVLGKGMPDLAALIYGELAAQQPARQEELLRKAARWAEASGDPAAAADWLAQLDDGSDSTSSDIVAERKRLLVAAGESDALLELASWLVESAPQDKALVADAVSLAQSVGEFDQAIAWNERYLQGNSDDLDAVATAIELSMATGNLSSARHWAGIELAQKSDDTASLARAAQLAEWSGDHQEALQLRQRIAEKGGTTSEWREVERLAVLLRMPATAAEALEHVALIREPDEALMSKLIAQHELVGLPKNAVRVIDAINTRYGASRWRLRERALLVQRHSDLEEALQSWETLAAHSGRDTEETLSRIELLWRLGRFEDALPLTRGLVELFKQQGPDPVPSEYQSNIVAELAWRYELSDVADLASQWMDEDFSADQRDKFAWRRIGTLDKAGLKLDASEEAENYWRATDQVDFLIAALRSSAETSDNARTRRLLQLVEATELESQQNQRDVLSIRAGLAIKAGNTSDARELYEQVRRIASDDSDALSGLLWLAIGQSDTAYLTRLLDENIASLSRDPGMWPAIAVALLRLGRSADSLPWFEKALTSVKSDYGLVLAWADALEQSQEVDKARRARRWAITDLRPRLVAGIRGHEGELIRQYGDALGRFASAEDNEAWMRLMLATDLDVSNHERIWREDMAIAWLMATERHEYARVVMARQHGERLNQPAWQDLALALHANDRRAVLAVLESGDGLSAAGRMLALREVGRDADAFALALRTIENPPSTHDLAVARTQYVDLRRYRPSHLTAGHSNVQIGSLSASESTFALRHAPGISGLGYALDIKRIDYASDRLANSALETRQRVQLGVFSDHSRQGMALYAGVDSDSQDSRLFAHGNWTLRDPHGRREIGLAIAWQEPADESSELRLVGKRDSLGITAEQVFANDAYVKLNAGAKRLSSRISDALLAKGIYTRAEVGIRRTAGSLAWGSSVSLASERNDRAERLPSEFVLGQGSSLNNVIAEERTTLSLNGSLARGGVGNHYPNMASPRFYINGSVGYAWPDERLGMNVNAGAGVRVIGQDELALRLKQSATLQGEDLAEDGRTLGIDYRFQF